MKNNVDLKFMRSILNYSFNNEKNILLDELYYGLNQTNDLDVISLIKINDFVSNNNIKLSAEILLNLYDNILPSISRSPLDISAVNAFYELFYLEKLKIKKALIYTLSGRIFNELTFQLLSIIICKLFHLKFNRYYIIHPKFYESLYNSIIENNEYNFSKIMANINTNNLNYYKKKKKYKVEEIRRIILENKKDYYFYGILKIYLFGSYAKNLDNEYSDIDLHIYSKIHSNIKEQELVLESYFGYILQTKVDVVIENDDKISNKSLYFNEILLYEG